MFFLRRPSDERIRRVLEEQRALPFSYPEVGGTRHVAPSGYPINHHREQIGTGRDAFERAKEAVRRWSMYNLRWTTLCWPEEPIREGAVVAVLVRHFRFWSVNPCRIVYVLDESDRYGFAFGTLPGHAEAGEERFTVEYHPKDESVWYEIYTFARANHWLVRLTPPLLRLVQHQFGRASVRAMRDAISRGAVAPE